MTCKDCIHYEVCSYRSQVELCNNYPSENCENYKDKKIEKSFATVMKVDGEELYRTVENVSVEMVDHQFEMIMQVVNNTYGNTTYRAITLDKKKLQQALINATPIRPHFSFEDNHAHCGTCYEELKSGYSFCPTCGRKIKWKYCNDAESMIQ